MYSTMMRLVGQWKREEISGGQYLIKTFEFDNYNQLQTFLSGITTAGSILQHDAEVIGSRPNTGKDISYVTLRLTTNDAGRTVTLLDELMSMTINRVYELLKA